MEKQTSDPFMRWYPRVLGALALLGLIWWISGIDWEARRLTGMLNDDTKLQAYPYRFRVIRVSNGVAVMTTPRSANASAMRFLKALKPSLAGKSFDDPALEAAQQELAERQAHARALVIADPEVNRVRWELDRRWYEERGIPLNPD